ncbi:MAG: zinc-binding dehydrogenase [Uliginosibacterium sp.]|nr:zinc-binding dehydrogenase [Uliginosibacterium sp.]
MLAPASSHRSQQAFGGSLAPRAQVDCVVSLAIRHLANSSRCSPRGHFGLIDASGPMDLRQFMAKNLSIHYQDMGMVTKSGPAEEYIRHQRILDRIARLVESGVLRSTVNAHLGKINVANMRRAHEIIESGRSVGKMVLEGF